MKKMDEASKTNAEVPMFSFARLFSKVFVCNVTFKCAIFPNNTKNIRA